MVEVVVRDGDCISLFSVAANLLPRVSESLVLPGVRSQTEPLTKRYTGVKQNPGVRGLNKDAERPDAKGLAAERSKCNRQAEQDDRLGDIKSGWIITQHIRLSLVCHYAICACATLPP